MSSPSPAYTLRRGTVDDIPSLVHHRVAMFQEMGTPGNYDTMAPAFAAWLDREMPIDGYRAWVIEDDAGKIVAGGGLIRHKRAPAPAGNEPYSGHIYNVYVEAGHRRVGLARRLMEVIHETCRTDGIRVVTLHASTDGRSLYESMGYQSTNEMRLILEPVS